MGKFRPIKKMKFKKRYLVLIICIILLYLLYVFVLKNIKLNANEYLTKKILSNTNSHMNIKEDSYLKKTIKELINNPIKIIKVNK